MTLKKSSFSLKLDQPGNLNNMTSDHSPSTRKDQNSPTESDPEPLLFFNSTVGSEIMISEPLVDVTTDKFYICRELPESENHALRLQNAISPLKLAEALEAIWEPDAKDQLAAGKIIGVSLMHLILQAPTLSTKLIVQMGCIGIPQDIKNAATDVLSWLCTDVMSKKFVNLDDVVKFSIDFAFDQNLSIHLAGMRAIRNLTSSSQNYCKEFMRISKFENILRFIDPDINPDSFMYASEISMSCITDIESPSAYLSNFYSNFFHHLMISAAYTTQPCIIFYTLNVISRSDNISNSRFFLDHLLDKCLSSQDLKVFELTINYLHKILQKDPANGLCALKSLAIYNPDAIRSVFEKLRLGRSDSEKKTLCILSLMAKTFPERFCPLLGQVELKKLSFLFQVGISPNVQFIIGIICSFVTAKVDAKILTENESCLVESLLSSLSLTEPFILPVPKLLLYIIKGAEDKKTVIEKILMAGGVTKLIDFVKTLEVCHLEEYLIVMDILNEVVKEFPNEESFSKLLTYMKCYLAKENQRSSTETLEIKTRKIAALLKIAWILSENGRMTLLIDYGIYDCLKQLLDIRRASTEFGFHNNGHYESDVDTKALIRHLIMTGGCFVDLLANVIDFMIKSLNDPVSQLSELLIGFLNNYQNLSASPFFEKVTKCKHMLLSWFEKVDKDGLIKDELYLDRSGIESLGKMIDVKNEDLTATLSVLRKIKKDKISSFVCNCSSSGIAEGEKLNFNVSKDVLEPVFSLFGSINELEEAVVNSVLDIFPKLGDPSDLAKFIQGNPNQVKALWSFTDSDIFAGQPSNIQLFIFSILKKTRNIFFSNHKPLLSSHGRLLRRLSNMVCRSGNLTDCRSHCGFEENSDDNRKLKVLRWMSCNAHLCREVHV